MKKLLAVRKTSDRHWVGDGFFVSSVFSYAEQGNPFDPFLLMDYAAPVEFAGDGKRRGVGGHPHKGFETVTIAYQGEVEHRDSSGGGGTIGAGDVQWMTAGAGIIHEEFHSTEFARTGGIFEMVQLWVNLPARHKGEAPGYQTLLSTDIPVVQATTGTGHVRVIAGEFGSTTGPARTFTPINLWDGDLKAGSSISLPAPDGHTTTVLVIKGRITLDGTDVDEAHLAIFDRAGAGLNLTAATDARFLVLTGEPINEPVVGHGPFVMNTEEEIADAFRQFRSGVMGALV